MKKNTYPLVSIGVPVYESARLVSKLIKSLKSQDYPNFEVVVSDNCSNDMTHDLLLSEIANDSRFRVFRQNKNIGAMNNFLFVLEKSRGEFFTWNAVDDYREKNWITINAFELSKNTRAVASFSRSYFEFNSTKSAIFNFQLEGNQRSRIKSFFSAARSSNPIFYSLARKSVLDKFAKSKKEYKAWDWNFNLQLILKGPIIFNTDSSMIFGTKGASRVPNFTSHLSRGYRINDANYSRFSINALKSCKGLKFKEYKLILGYLIKLNIREIYVLISRNLLRFPKTRVFLIKIINFWKTF